MGFVGAGRIQWEINTTMNQFLTGEHNGRMGLMPVLESVTEVHSILVGQLMQYVVVSLPLLVIPKRVFVRDNRR